MKSGLGLIFLIGALVVLLSYGNQMSITAKGQSRVDKGAPSLEKKKGVKQATLAAGCFWGVEAALQKVKGVESTTVGYTGGTDAKPSYPKVCSGDTGHAEAVQVFYDPEVVSYEKILEEFFRLHKPFYDQRSYKGGQYRSAIFYRTEKERQIATDVKKRFEKEYKQKLYTVIKPAKAFHEAEEYHQDYYKKNRM